MKKVMCLMALPVLCLLSLLLMSMGLKTADDSHGDFPILTANTSGGTGGGGGSGGAYGYYQCSPSTAGEEPNTNEIPFPTTFDYCLYNSPINLFAANLETTPGQIGDVIDLSSSPPMYLKVSLADPNFPANSVQVTKPITSWTLIQIADNGEAVYHSCTQFDVPVDYFCQPGQNLSLTASYEILTTGLSGLVPFDVCNHNDYGQIYSCYVFESIPCDGSFCNSSNYNSFSTTITGVCPTDCRSQVNSVGGQYDSSQANDLTKTFELETFPNPFDDQLSYSWTRNLTQTSKIALYDTAGKLISSEDLKGHSGRKNIDTSTLGKGIYFLVVEYEGEKAFYKVVKL